MKKLDRDAVPAPPCLAEYDHRRKTWDDVTPEHKKEIRSHLEALQGKRCAYCETDLSAVPSHIEHFRRKSRHSPLTFEWKNLYWSCDEKDSCGHFKDHGAGKYDPADLVEPCVHDPDRYLRFRSDGSVVLPRNIDPGDRRRAEETLRVFHLQGSVRLRNMRRAVAAGYVSEVDDLATFAPEDRRAYVEETLASIAGLPFSTLIRHLFEDVV